MEDGGGPWYDYLPITPEEKQRIADLHKENERYLFWTIALGIAWTLLILVCIFTGPRCGIPTSWAAAPSNRRSEPPLIFHSTKPS